MDTKSLEERLEYRKENHRYMNDLGIVVEEFDEKSATSSLVIEERHLNANGKMNGGVALAMADIAAGTVVLSQEGNTVTLDLTYKFLRPVNLGDKLVAKADIVRAGRTTIVVEVNFFVGEKKVGVALTSFYRLQD